MRTLLLSAALVAFAGAAQAQQAVDPATLDRYVASLWSKASPEWQARNTMDETQKVCSATHNQPTKEQFDAILAREKTTVKLPADGVVIGDWKAGRTVAQRGSGGQFSDQPNTYRGGNCYACHQLSKAEVSFGTLGPSLLSYGRERKYDPAEAKATFAKIYNAQSVFPCSTMPRFGHTGFLSETQIKDVVAYLFDPESPVNKH
jgi:sulfur-oxidizing protein SoxX